MVKNTFSIRRILLLPFILITFALLSLLGLTACGRGESSELSLINMGFSIRVTYDYNGGTVNSAQSLVIRLRPNSLIPAPQETGNVRFPGRTGFTFRHYCIALKDEEGNLLRDEQNNLVPGDVWDFENDRVGEGEDEITLIAQWWESYNLIMYYGDDFSQTQTVNVQRDVATGSPLRLAGYYFNSFYNSDTLQIAGHYKDREMTQRLDVKNGYRFTDADFQNAEIENTVELWLKTVSKSYTVINDANDFVAYDANLTSTTNDGASLVYYINDDIDMTGWQSNSKVLFPREFTGEVIGNGHTISNYRMVAGASSDQNESYGIFKILGDGARVSNIKFENVKATYNLANIARIREYRVGLLAGQVKSGATLENVTVNGTMEYTMSSGFNGRLVTDSDLIGTSITGATITNVTTDGITVNGSVYIQSEDSSYLVYAKTVKENGTTTLGDVYGIAAVSDDNVSAITVRTVEKVSDGVFKLTSRKGQVTTVYTVTVSDNAGVYSASVSVGQ